MVTQVRHTRNVCDISAHLSTTCNLWYTSLCNSYNIQQIQFQWCITTETIFGVIVVNDKYIPDSCDRHEDLKQMLDSNKDNLKLEAMKRIIGVSNIALILLLYYVDIFIVTAYEENYPFYFFL